MADMKNILVVGSLAYDHVMTYGKSFQEVMLPGRFDVALTTQSHLVSFGGCSGNIAYNLRLMRQQPMILTVAGSDFKQYQDRLVQLRVKLDGVYVSDKFPTATAFIVTDPEGHQITVFDGGAMSAVDTATTVKSLGGADAFAYVIISPDKPERMLRVADECYELQIPYFFDPAQQMNNFKPEDLLRVIQNAFVLIVNEYEADLLSKKIGVPREGLAALSKNSIETHGARGCTIKSAEGMSFVRAAQPSQIVDPTGCGDAFRAGVVAGLMQGKNFQESCQIGALLATYNLEHQGTQSHSFTVEEFAARLEDTFGG